MENDATNWERGYYQDESQSLRRLVEEIDLVREVLDSEHICLGYVYSHLEAALREAAHAIEQRHSQPDGCPKYLTAKCARSLVCIRARARLAPRSDRGIRGA